jgi:outer membrane protein assembly factor BamB
VNRATGLALSLLLLAVPAAAQDASKKGPPAFVPLESAAAGAQLRAAAGLARAGKTAEAVEAYQAVSDGPLATMLAAHDRDRDTLEQAGERAQREVASLPALRDAHRARYGATAAKLLAAALDRGDTRGLRDLNTRFPLTDAGGAAGLMLARAAWRAGEAGECLGLLDRMESLQGDGPPAGYGKADLLALRASAAAATGDADLLAATARAAAAALPGDEALAARIAAARAAVAPAGPKGPGGRLVVRWTWRPAEEDLPETDDGSRTALIPTGFPPPPNHLLAVSGDRVFWADRFRVTSLDLATGRVLARSVPLAEGFRPAAPGEAHEGETFAPAADGRFVVCPLDLPEGSATGGRAGTLNLFDRDLRLLARRGGDADLEHPAMRRRFVFHGRPLLLGDRVYCAATEAGAEAGAGGDVRTHVLAFRRDGLEPIWDAFVAYGMGIRRPEVAPAGSLAERHGRLYFATNTGLEACLDARTGAVLWAHRYRTPEAAQVPRLASTPDQTTTPPLWYESPPVFSGDLVAFAARDSYTIDFMYQRPLRGSGPGRWDAGYLRNEGFERPRQDTEAMTAGWILPGPAGTFFLAGQAAHREAAPLLQRDLATPREDPILWRAALEELQVVGLPVRAADALWAATDKAVYRVPFPASDAAERVAVFPASGRDAPVPSPGNLLVLPDAVLSVHDDGIICFGPPPPTTPR